MKNFAICLVMAVFMLSGLSHADVYIMHKGETPIGFSEQNDMVLEPGAEITVLKGTLADLSLSRPLDEYKFTGKKLKVNADAVKAKEDKQLEQEQKINAKKAKKQSAKDKLKALGLDEDDLQALFEKD